MLITQVDNLSLELAHQIENDMKGASWYDHKEKMQSRVILNQLSDSEHCKALFVDAWNRTLDEKMNIQGPVALLTIFLVPCQYKKQK